MAKNKSWEHRKKAMKSTECWRTLSIRLVGMSFNALDCFNGTDDETVFS